MKYSVKYHFFNPHRNYFEEFQNFDNAWEALTNALEDVGCSQLYINNVLTFQYDWRTESIESYISYDRLKQDGVGLYLDGERLDFELIYDSWSKFFRHKTGVGFGNVRSHGWKFYKNVCEYLTQVGEHAHDISCGKINLEEFN